MIFRIIRERKEREFDPALQALRTVVEDVDNTENKKVVQQLINIAEIFTVFDGIMNKYLNSEENSKKMLDFI